MIQGLGIITLGNHTVMTLLEVVTSQLKSETGQNYSIKKFSLPYL